MRRQEIKKDFLSLGDATKFFGDATIFPNISYYSNYIQNSYKLEAVIAYDCNVIIVIDETKYSHLDYAYRLLAISKDTAYIYEQVIPILKRHGYDVIVTTFKQGEEQKRQMHRWVDEKEIAYPYRMEASKEDIQEVIKEISDALQNPNRDDNLVFQE